MMATWNKRGIRLGYPLPSSPNESDLDQKIDIPDNAFEAMYLNLAVRISSGFGKQLAPQTRIEATRTYLELLSDSMDLPEQALDYRSAPSGAGNKSWSFRGSPFLAKAKEPLTTGSDDILEIGGHRDDTN